MSSPAGGSLLFTGFTKLCKGLAVVLVGGHILVQLLPASVSVLALIPARTIPFAWNLLTAGYIEQTVHGVRPSFDVKKFTYMPLSGFQGVLAGFLVGIKQIVPDQELYLLKIKAKWLPSLMLLLSIAISFFTAESAAYLPTLIFGTYMGWIYLRYLQKKPETKLSGDPSDDFAFSSFFPEFIRPVIDPIASIFHRMLCGRRTETSGDDHGYTLGGASLPGSDPIEASRRRERGARALEERLATEKLAAAQSVEESKKDAAENV
ncbi:hypothetical protein CISIN_1g021779mg [Citrus sinensis]|uniref:Uncharacterized protein n=1 Tax=Citrus sinensis TaxID=2711 RepID=A0A067DZZ9_CITSI|nr:hypothetical protein CISIN_1g021779mg [Citrus sinensis]